MIKRYFYLILFLIISLFCGCHSVNNTKLIVLNEIEKYIYDNEIEKYVYEKLENNNEIKLKVQDVFMIHEYQYRLKIILKSNTDFDYSYDMNVLTDEWLCGKYDGEFIFMVEKPYIIYTNDTEPYAIVKKAEKKLKHSLGFGKALTYKVEIYVPKHSLKGAIGSNGKFEPDENLKIN